MNVFVNMTVYGVCVCVYAIIGQDILITCTCTNPSPSRAGGGLGGTRRGAPAENIKYSGRVDER